ncbi:O-antigen ligase family protein [Kaarinaea lacus]
MNSLRLNHLSLALGICAFIASLFFNGIDIRFFSLTYLFLLGWILLNSISAYRKGYKLGNLLIPVSIILFWLWLGFSIVFSPVFYLSVINFWWVGIFPLMFIIYSSSPDKDSIWRLSFTSIVLVVVLLGLYALYQGLILQDQPRATFYNKNSLAALINLLIFPTLATNLKANHKIKRYINVATVFLFALLLGLINSRGALIAFFVSLFFVLVLTWHQYEKRRLLQIGLVIISAFVTAHLLMNYMPQITATGMVDRMLTLQDTQTAGQSRFVIWQPAWELFLQHPWTGIGLGTYFLAIPPTLHIDDHSAGFYVHNDYLQIALETGIPALILLLFILFAMLFGLINALRVRHKEDSQRLHFLVLFAALLTLVVHSFFTYNFYLMPIMLVAGLFLGRFNHVVDQLQTGQLLTWQPAKLFRPAIYYMTFAFITITLSSYFISMGIAYHYQHKGYHLAAANQLEDAHHAFRIAQKLAPRVDSAYYADADLLRKSALVLANRPELAKGLLEEAQELLARAEELNPLRAQTPYIHGLVLEQASPEMQTDIIVAYQTALKRNPRFIPARLALARYLIKHDDQDHAFQLLQDGLAYSYRQLSPAYLELVEMTSAAAVSMGNTQLADYLSALLATSRKDYTTMLSGQRQQKILNPY